MTIALEDSFVFAEDKALKTLLQGITVSDLKSAPRPVKVWFGYPDVELRQRLAGAALVPLEWIVLAHA